MAEKKLNDTKFLYPTYPVNTNTVELIEKRKNFDTLPSFVQAGLFLYEKYVNTRRQEFLPRILAFNVIKIEGNNLFSRGDYDEAARKYEEVIPVVHYRH
jgi:hypothetical protein